MRTSSTPLKGKQACIVAGEEWLEGEGGDPKEAKQTKETTEKKKRRRKQTLRVSALELT